MSHVASGEPPSDIAVGAYTIDKTGAIFTAGTSSYAVIRADVNMAAASGTLTTLYTTEASRGRFILTAVNVVVQRGQTPAVAPQISIGHIGASYDQLVSATTLTTISTAPAYGPNLFENATTIFARTLTVSVPASTAIICRLISSSAATFDLRTIGLSGFYTG